MDIRRQRGAGFWMVMALAVVILLFGVAIAAGGAWLVALGGSWYYLVAGLGLLLTGGLLLRTSIAAVWVYLVVYAGTVAWAFWEAGWNLWAQVPRLVAPTLVLILVLLAVPVLRRAGQRLRTVPTVAGMLAILGAGLLLNATNGNAQDAVPTDQPDAPAARAETPPVGDEGGAPAPDPAPAQAPGGAGTGEELPAAPAASEARAPAPVLQTGADWPAYGGTTEARRYSPLDQIDPANVSDLERVWTFNTGDLPSEAADGRYSPENTPLKVGDDLYICTPMGRIIAVDAATGLEEWRFDPGVSDDAIPYGATCRGVAYYEVPDAAPDEACARRILWGTLDARLIAIDAQLGQPCPDFGLNGEVNLEEGIGDTVPGWYSVTSPPTIVRGVAVLGAQVKDGQAEDSPSGVVRGYDAVTGELAWAWDLGNPGNRGAPPEGEVYTRGTPNMWTIAAADEELGLVYLPLGNSAVDYYGSNRSEAENEYATSLVAVDVTTGEDVWHFRTVHNDVWDYDLGSQPSLVDFATEEGSRPALILSTKQGDIFVLDRATGEPLVPVEERPVPADLGVEPDYLSPVQPFSTYHSLLKPDLEERHMWGMTPLDQLWCRIQFRQAYYRGVYTPPTADARWIQYPGYNGGQDWGSMAVDMERGLLIANYNDMPNFNRLLPRAEAEEMGVQAIFEPDYDPDGPEAGPQIGSPYAISVNAGWRVKLTGLLCKEPPYGGIRAIDLATGETVWDEPLGTARRNGPFGIPSLLPMKIGTPNNGGPIVTAGGLIFIAATTDNLLSAIDLQTGKTLWQDVLPGGGQTTPITYEVGGRQFVVIYPGGHHFMETPISDEVVAYALPEGGP
ncbi:pyrroloquinoline quinone-dependent dehydrogenase [Cereibacter sphaeroides]|uniref:pyrroloquinoline quinone-dependent dehydrogenase n=1 Tax=Cereibacter sphaeroides TaxID=1063 RepID=UPI001F46481C|nr:pyrroloquinoline quinone-dependent dehydrogenase [Cereibacter sphaeroides]MCE6951529.1 pyrroloquinoline quinone-dependent dehydrogenase [Cereibacter sphaeroides]